MYTGNRGSEWRKWDLHVHTKYTNRNDHFKRSTNFKEFCATLFKKALEKNIKAIGITDYFSIDNYKKVKDYVDGLDSNNDFNKNEKSLIKDIFLLPNVELRLLPTTDHGRLINIHCLFNPDNTFLETLDNDFFGSLEDTGGHKMNRNGFIELGKKSDLNLDDVCAYKKGIDNYVLEPSKLKKLFENNMRLRENSITVVSNSSHDGASALQKHYNLFENESGSLDATRRNIYKLSDAIFSGNSKDREFFLGEKDGCNTSQIINICGSLKPCIHGSDAHCEEKLFNPDNNRYCWIKADLTFDGLKQILCEPKDRVKIDANMPEKKSGYHVIKSINMDNDICKQSISFNPNLNAIIGGRSTGKSTLLQLIAHRVDSNIPSIDQHISKIHKEDITIIWQDGEENKGREIEFFPQSHMYDIARDAEKKNKLIQAIIEEKDEKKLVKNYDKFCVDNKSIIQSNVDNLFKLQGNIVDLNTALKEKGDEIGLKKEIELLHLKIKESQQEYSLLEEDLTQYENIKKEISNIEQLLQKQQKDKHEIENLKNEELFESSFVYKFNQISELNSKKIREIFNSVQQMATKEWLDKLSIQLTDIDKCLEKNEKDILEIKKSKIFTKGNNQLEKNKQYKELSDRLMTEQKKLAEITSLQKQLADINKQKQELLDITIQNHIYFISKTDDLTNDFVLIHDDIEIKIEKIYSEDSSKDLLKSFMNLKSHERQDIVDNWGEKYKSDPKSHIMWFLQEALENNIELKAYKEINDFVKNILTENWFSISYELTYQNDTFDIMSDGKKAFVILKLLLEFSDKKCPILIDQPEDSLDNRDIYNELVVYLKNKKKERQIILVTHNPNIVVNADSEEVIVANQHGEDSKNQNGIKFQYITGSLENTKPKDKKSYFTLESQGIREHVCEILEGGTEAFKKRENKYAINLNNKSYNR